MTILLGVWVYFVSQLDWFSIFIIENNLKLRERENTWLLGFCLIEEKQLNLKMEESVLGGFFGLGFVSFAG